MSNTARIIREKETFRTEQVLNVGGEDVKMYAKASVNYERLSFKVQPILTMVHGSGKETDQAMKEVAGLARAECQTRLAQYRDEAGIGSQTEFNFEGEGEGESAANN